MLSDGRWRAPFFALPAVLLLGAFLRFHDLSRFPPGLHSDEAMNGLNALQAVHERRIQVFYPENNGREGLFINLQALSVWFFGNTPWALRVVSAVFGVATLLGVFLLIRELLTSEVALATTFLVATSFWHVVLSRIGFRAISAPFWCVWAFYLLLVSRRRQSRPLSIVAGLVFGLGFHSYTAYRVMPLVLAVLFALQAAAARRAGVVRRFVLHAMLVGLGAIVASAPLALYFARHPDQLFARSNQVSVFQSTSPVLHLARNAVITMAMFNAVGDTNPRHNLTGRPWLASLAGRVGATAEQQQLVLHLGRPQLVWPVGLLFLAGFYLSCRRALGEGRLLTKEAAACPHLFLVSWFVIAALPAVLSDEDLPHALRTILMIPPVFTFAAIGAFGVREAVVRSIVKAGVNPPGYAWSLTASLLALLLAWNTYATYFNRWGPDARTARAFDKADADKAYEIRAIGSDVPKIVVAPPDGLDVHVAQFLTDSGTLQTQSERHIRYVTPGEIDLASLPPDARVIELR